MSAVAAPITGPAVTGRAPVPILRQLATPATPADRRRERLVTLALTGCGVFLLAAFAISTIQDVVIPVDPNDPRYVGTGDMVMPAGGQQLADYIWQPGLRGGTSFGAALLALPFVLLAVQALRTGTAARERRLAALSLAGATRGQLRRVAAWEGTRAAVLGGLLAGPAYLLTWVAIGLLPPPKARMLPRPEPELLAAWAVLIAVLALGGAVAGARASRPAGVTPLGLVRRAPRPVNVAWRAAGPAIGVAIMAAAYAIATEDGGSAPLYLFLVGLGIFALTIGGALVLGSARVAAGRGLVSSMAAARLAADSRASGRIAGVLFAVGIAFGIIGGEATSMQDGNYALSDIAFYAGGLALAGAAACLAVVVAVSSLVIGATEQVLDGRRGVAVLVALAASPELVVSVVRRQLLLVAVPPVVLGALLAWCFSVGTNEHLVTDAPYLMPVLAAAGGAAWLAAVVAARFVRPAVLEAAQPESLRAP